MDKIPAATHGETSWNGVNKNAADKRKLWKDCGTWQTKNKERYQEAKRITKTATYQAECVAKRKRWRVSVREAIRKNEALKKT